jgi:hypothetical protein
MGSCFQTDVEKIGVSTRIDTGLLDVGSPASKALLSK